MTGPTANTPTVANAFGTPVGIAFDASGNLFVTDYSTSYGFGRVLVFQPPFQNKQSAVRIMGINSTSATAAQTVLGLPGGIFFIPASQMPSGTAAMGVLDTGDSRILLFDSFDSGKWPDPHVSFSPRPSPSSGQPNLPTWQGNAGTGISTSLPHAVHAVTAPPPQCFPAASCLWPIPEQPRAGAALYGRRIRRGHAGSGAKHDLTMSAAQPD